MILVLGIIAVGALLDSAGIFTYEEAVVFFGLREKAVSDAEVSVHFIDVGQGDSSLIISGKGSILIDAGETDQGQRVIEYLRSQNIKKLDYVIATHPHSDHIGGMADVLSEIKTDNIIYPDVPDELVTDAFCYSRMLDVIEEKGINVIIAAPGEKYSIGPSVIKITGPCGTSDDINNYSAAAEIIHGDNIFLFTGDCERDAEDDMLRKHMIDDADVLKVGHHGSSSSSSFGFLKIAKPEYAVISCGSDNPYGHPNQAAVERIALFADTILRTDIEGTIVFESDGKNISIAGIK